jgi:hemolysin activation/secretion protein
MLFLKVAFGQVGGSNSKNLIGTQLSGGVLGLRGTFKRFSYDLFVGEPLYKPKGFEAPSAVVGFSINMSVF